MFMPLAHAFIGGMLSILAIDLVIDRAKDRITRKPFYTRLLLYLAVCVLNVSMATTYI